MTKPKAAKESAGTPQKRRTSGDRDLTKFLEAGKATRFRPGNRVNPGGSNKKAALEERLFLHI